MRVVCSAALYPFRHPHDSLEAVVPDDRATSVDRGSVDPGRPEYA
jgi:hypothetical protein